MMHQFDFWQTIDDLEGEFRLWCAVAHNKENNTITIFCQDQASDAFNYTSLKKRAWLAAQKGTYFIFSFLFFLTIMSDKSH
jgi:hypothetical protein